MTTSEIASKLTKAKKTASGYLACCPAHDDRSPSLSISEGSGGKILLKCFAGCSTDSIVRAIGLEMKDLFTDTVIRLNGNGSTASPKAAKVANVTFTISTASTAYRITCPN